MPKSTKPSYATYDKSDTRRAGSSTISLQGNLDQSESMLSQSRGNDCHALVTLRQPSASQYAQAGVLSLPQMHYQPLPPHSPKPQHLHLEIVTRRPVTSLPPQSRLPGPPVSTEQVEPPRMLRGVQSGGAPISAIGHMTCIGRLTYIQSTGRGGFSYGFRRRKFLGVMDRLIVYGKQTLCSVGVGEKLDAFGGP